MPKTLSRTDVFVVTYSQISTLAHAIKLIPSSQSASDLNDWRMALQQEIRERRQVLREAHRLQRTVAPWHRTIPEVVSRILNAGRTLVDLVSVKSRYLWERG